MNKDIAIFGDTKSVMPAHLASQKIVLGNENLETKDFAMPQIKVLQALSPECEEIAEAKPGMLYNTITKEVLSSMFVINLKYDREYTIFKKRQLGGGYNGTFPTLESANAAASTLPGASADYDITETAKHILLVLDAEGKPKQLAAIYMSKSALEVSRQWNSKIQIASQGKDRFSRVWNLCSLKKSNSQGSWFVPEVQDLGWAPEELYARAKHEFLALSGTAQAEAA